MCEEAESELKAHKLINIFNAVVCYNKETNVTKEKQKKAQHKKFEKIIFKKYKYTPKTKSPDGPHGSI